MMRPIDIALFILRLTTAVVMWPHGAQKALGLFGGFFMNFAGNQKGEGIEFFIFAVGISLAPVIAGSGRIALLPKT